MEHSTFKPIQAATKPSVMILSAAAATGHLRAAEALVAAFEGRGVPAQHVEVLRYTNPIFRKIYSDLYVELMNRGPDQLRSLGMRTRSGNCEPYPRSRREEQ